MGGACPGGTRTHDLRIKVRCHARYGGTTATFYRGAMDFSIPADIQALLNECGAFIDDVIVPIEAGATSASSTTGARTLAPTGIAMVSRMPVTLLGRMQAKPMPPAFCFTNSAPFRGCGGQPGHGDRA